MLYSHDAEKDRAFFRDVLKFTAVDAGGGWLIFALPPAEVAMHPAGSDKQLSGGLDFLKTELYLMCDDLAEAIKSLKANKVRCSPVEEAGWGSKTTIQLPSGGRIGLYQPKHASPLSLGRRNTPQS